MPYGRGPQPTRAPRPGRYEQLPDLPYRARHRGYGEQRVEEDLNDIGVRYVALPRKGKPNPARRTVEQRRAFKKMVRWRTGCEGRISCAKRDFGLARTRQDGIDGTRTWCGHGIFATIS